MNKQKGQVTYWMGTGKAVRKREYFSRILKGKGELTKRTEGHVFMCKLTCEQKTWRCRTRKP
jgi:hypothetical protein